MNDNDADEKTDAPKFTEVQTVREELDFAIWGSQGWRIYFPSKSTYIYAGFDRYLLRYNISDNEIYRAVKLGDITLAAYKIRIGVLL